MVRAVVLGALGVAAIGDREVGACASAAYGDRAADAAGRAGHQHDLAVQPHAASPRSHPRANFINPNISGP